MTTTPTSRPDPTIPLLDLANATCPMAFVKSRLFLDKCRGGAIVEILYEDTPANEPLLRSIEALGHQISDNSANTMSNANSQPPFQNSVQTQSNTTLLKSIFILVKK